MQKSTQDNYFPILIDLRKMKVLVIGGGKIGARKVVNLIDYNTDVTVIAPDFTKELLLLAEQKRIKIIQKTYTFGDTVGFDIVFCSTGNREVDVKVYEECKERGILLNVADVPELCNFIIPATIKRGSLTISIGSQGKAPFFVSGLKKNLSKQFGEEYSGILEIASELRAEMMKLGIYEDEKARGKIFDEFFKIDFSSIIKSKGKDAARQTALSLLEI